MAIIAISGRIGSGKDTVGKIIQYLIAQKHQNTSESFRNDSSRDYRGSGWEVKKFATKLKMMVSLITGIPVADLERQEVKDRVLGPEWNMYNVTYPFRYRNAAELETEIKQSNVKIVNPDLIVIEYGLFQVILAHKVVNLTVRELLQKLGTDAMRDVVHPNIHVNALFADYKPTALIGLENHTWDPDPLPNWLITDLRFPNELEAVEQRGGITIRVERPATKSTGPRLVSLQASDEAQAEHDRLGEIFANNTHPSETALDSAQFAYTIHNNGSIEDLISSVKGVLRKAQII